MGTEEERPWLPKFYCYLDEADPDVVILRRREGAFVAAFSARGASREGILEAAEEDYRGVAEARSGSAVSEEEDERQWSA